MRLGQMSEMPIAEFANMGTCGLDMSTYNIKAFLLIISLPVSTKSKPQSELAIGTIAIMACIVKEGLTIRSKDQLCNMV